MTTFGNKAAELIAEAAVADDAALPVYNVRAATSAGAARRGCGTAFKPFGARNAASRSATR